MLVKFNHGVLSLGTTSPSFVQAMARGGDPVASQYKYTSSPSVRVTSPYATFKDICTGTGK